MFRSLIWFINKYRIFSVVTALCTLFYIKLLGFSVYEMREEEAKSIFLSRESDPINIIQEYKAEFSEGYKDSFEVDGVELDMRVEVWINHIDTSSQNMELTFFYFPSDTKLVDSDTFPGINYTLISDFTYRKELHRKGSIMRPVLFNAPLISGSDNFYPFDEYYSNVNLKVIQLPQNLPLKLDVCVIVFTPSLWFDVIRVPSNSSINLGISIENEENRLKKESKELMAQDSDQYLGTYSFNILVTRSISVIIFSLAINIFQWVLTISMVMMTCNLVVHSRFRPDATLLGLGPAILLSLPTLRHAQPGIPPIGIILDFGGFFW